MKRRAAGAAFLPDQAFAAGQGADMRKHRVDTRAVAGDSAIDSFACQKERAADPARFAQVQKRATDCAWISKAREVIECCNCKHADQIRLFAGPFKPTSAALMPQSPVRPPRR